MHVFRTLVSQTRETRIERALSAGLNLRIGAEYIDGMEKVGPWVEEVEGVRRLKDAEPRQVSLPTDDPSDGASDDSAEFGDTVGPTSGEVGQ